VVKIRALKGLNLQPTAGTPENNSIFIDVADFKLKKKDNVGVISEVGVGASVQAQITANTVGVLENALAIEERGGWEEIARVDLTVTTSEVIFSNLSTSFKLLNLFIFTSSSIANLRAQFNDVTSGIYSAFFEDGSSISSETSMRLTTGNNILIESLIRGETRGGANQVQVNSFFTINGVTGMVSAITNTNPAFAGGITKIKLFPLSGSFSSNVTFILFGMK